MADDHEVIVSFTFSAMAESPDQALARCLEWFSTPPPGATCLPLRMSAKVEPK